eukprot:2854662-Amphidinium_carterae.1
MSNLALVSVRPTGAGRGFLLWGINRCFCNSLSNSDLCWDNLVNLSMHFGGHKSLRFRTLESSLPPVWGVPPHILNPMLD